MTSIRLIAGHRHSAFAGALRARFDRRVELVCDGPSTKKTPGIRGGWRVEWTDGPTEAQMRE